MGINQVFNAGSVKSGSEQKSSVSGLRKKGSGPAIDNSLNSRFASIDFGKIRRAFNKEYRVPKVDLLDEEIYTGDHNGITNVDSIINSALAQHEKRMKQNFLFDRIRTFVYEIDLLNFLLEAIEKKLNE